MTSGTSAPKVIQWIILGCLLVVTFAGCQSSVRSKAPEMVPPSIRQLTERQDVRARALACTSRDVIPRVTGASVARETRRASRERPDDAREAAALSRQRAGARKRSVITYYNARRRAHQHGCLEQKCIALDYLGGSALAPPPDARRFRHRRRRDARAERERANPSAPPADAPGGIA